MRHSLSDAPVASRRVRSVSARMSSMDTSERVAGKRWARPACSGGSMWAAAATAASRIRGILGWEGGVQALYQGLVDGSDVLGAVVGDGEEPRTAISCTGLSRRVPMGDEGVDGLGHHIGLHA